MIAALVVKKNGETRLVAIERPYPELKMAVLGRFGCMPATVDDVAVPFPHEVITFRRCGLESPIYEEEA